MSKDNITDIFPPSALEGVLPADHATSGVRTKSQTDTVPETDTAHEPHVYGVAQLLAGIRETLDIEFNPLWVKGEISGFSRAASGHCYFSLRESSSTLKCVMFRSAVSNTVFALENGLHVSCHGILNIYEGRGDLQIIVDRMKQAGEGMLFAEFERVKKQLESEGLFDPLAKKTIPEFPERIFLITSPAGAAVRDFIKTARSRWAGVGIILVPTLVQGASAVPEITAAIRKADSMASCRDVIVITRGGGSLEDLWTFNEEETARAVYQCNTPVISAIGHETDFTITDLVADLRAATPTAAASAATPEAFKLRQGINTLAGRSGRAMGHIITSGRHRIQFLTQRLKDPGSRLAEQQQRLDEMMLRLEHGIQRIILSGRSRQEHLSSRLQINSPAGFIEKMAMKLHSYRRSLYRGMYYNLSTNRARARHAISQLDSTGPLSILARGYSLVHVQGSSRLLRDSREVSTGDIVVIRLQSGTVRCQVLDTRGLSENRMDDVAPRSRSS